MRYCRKCGMYVRDDHVCKLWEVWGEDDEGEDDAVEIGAPDPESAAEKWAERHDEDGAMAESSTLYKVFVKNEKGEVETYNIRAQVETNYHAERCPEEVR